jgi:hypothetical protein
MLRSHSEDLQTAWCLTRFVIRACLHELQMSKSHLDTLLSDTSSTLNLLSNLSQDFKAVELQTSSFQKQCEGLLSAQNRDSELATEIQDNLYYYDFLDPASRRLNAPGAGNTVRGQEFSDMLKRLDECLDYMEINVSTIFECDLVSCTLAEPSLIDRSKRGECVPLQV